MSDDEKRCPKCDKVKPVSEFYKNRRQRDGLSVWCKEDTNKDNKKRREDDPEKYRQQAKSYYDRNKDKMYEYNLQWARNNRGSRRETERKYRQNNLDKRLYWESNRRARKLGKTVDFPSNGREILFEFYGESCMNPSCDKEISERNPITMDHVIPISWPDGFHSLDNMQLLCLSCNASKGNDSNIDYREGRICGSALTPQYQ